VIRPLAFGLIAALALAASAQAQTPAAPAAPAMAAATPYYSSKTTIGELLDNPATKAVLVKWVPYMVANPQIDQGRPYPLNAVTAYVPELTPEMLAKIDADLATIPKP
jgi:para-nitrobenzyl esterase